jgi:hypothetical protein
MYVCDAALAHPNVRCPRKFAKAGFTSLQKLGERSSSITGQVIIVRKTWSVMFYEGSIKTVFRRYSGTLSLLQCFSDTIKALFKALLRRYSARCFW